MATSRESPGELWVRDKLAQFLALRDPTAVTVYGPYPPSKGRSRWRVQIYDKATGTKRSITVASRDEAEQLMPLLRDELRRHTPLLAHDAIAQYLEHKSAVVTPAWIHLLGQRLQTMIPNVPLAQITAEQAETLYSAETRRAGKFGTIRAATHQAALRNTKQFFRWLCRRGLLGSNPFERVEPIGRPSAGKVQPRETDAVKLDAVLSVAATDGDEGALALLVQIYLGLRSSEVLALRVAAVEREGRKINIVRGKSRNAKRSLELFDDVAVLLWAHCKGRPDTQRVFAANLTHQPRPSWMYKRLQKYCRQAGVADFCPHSLRGLHSTLALTSGATTHAVAASLGHASFATTARHYADPSAIDNARARRVVTALKAGAAASSLDTLIGALSDAERERLRKLLGSDPSSA